ncbi:MAG: threonine synthase [Methyloligellaceae bacterium]
MPTAATFIDPASGQTYPLKEPRRQASNGNPLTISDLPGITRAEIDAPNRSIWRYAKSLPIPIQCPISLGEGCTPLIGSEIDGRQFHFKLEWFSPTGSFKDRGASVLMSFLKQQGISKVVEDSSGNAGAAIAAYGAAAGMDVTILVPSYTQSAKIVQSRAYGAEVILVPGAREDTATAAVKMAENIFYASHNWHPMFLQGTKSLGYEIWEDLGFAVPDNIVIPASEGSNVLGCYIAFKELMRAGEIDRMPRLFASQPENSAPLHHALQGTRQKRFLPTVAEGTAVKSPTRLQTMVQAIQETNGGSVAISEEEIISASKRLARAGIFTEPSSAHAWVGAKKLIEDGRIDRSDRTVVILTGTGLKAQSVYSE